MTRARLRLALALALCLCALGPLAPPADAHGGDNLARPIFERASPPMPGVDIQIVFSVNYEVLLKNTTPTEVTIMADSGEPFLRIGPKGVFANFISPTWYNSNVPDGLDKFPQGAQPGTGVEPNWKWVSREPSWGWYDHRLHPAERYVSKKIQTANKKTTLGHWRIPVRYGDAQTELAGRFEFEPVFGTYRAMLKSPETLADGVKVQVVPARTVPAIYLENTSPTPVTVLGKEGEPFVRIGPKAEVNLNSPSWVEMAQARGETPEQKADAQAPPNWREIQATPRWSWLEFRAINPATDPPKAIIQRNSPTTVKTWSVPLLIGDRRTEVQGFTQFVPIAAMRAEASGQGATGAKSGGSKLLPIFTALALATVAVGFFVLRPRKKAPPAPAPDPARHRSRATPKVRR